MDRKKPLIEISSFGSPIPPGIKTKQTNPYNYDPIELFSIEEVGNSTIYSDRLISLDFKKHDKLLQELFGDIGQFWSYRTPEQIELFLQRWLDNSHLRLVKVVEYCNQVTGYPNWRFDFIA